MKKYGLSLVSAAALTCAVLAPAAFSQDTGVNMAPAAVPVAAPQNIPYPGTLKVTVDATDLDHRIFQVNESIPVTGEGDLVLMLPKWLPGHHSPGTEISRIDVTNAKASGARRYVVTVGSGGQIRMCDPDSRLNGTLQGCT